MKRTLLMASWIIVLAGCSTGDRCRMPTSETAPPPKAGSDLAVLEEFATRAPNAVPERIKAILAGFTKEGKQDHLPYLAEHGLRVHWKNLTGTRLARELPVGKNPVLAELVRLAKIEKYKTAHEAGWLNNQFYGKFSRTGYSSYQVYIWAKERRVWQQSWPNAKRLAALLKEIDRSGLAGVGAGDGVCHYGCK